MAATSGGPTSGLERGLTAGLALILALTALDWGLPNHIGWDVDSIAPHGPIALGLGDVDALDPIYPLFHHALSAAAYWPLLRAEAATGAWQPEVYRANPLRGFDDPFGTLSTLILVSRLLTALMAVGCVLLVHSLARERLQSAGGARLVAALCATGHAFAYYSHTGNLDVPYLFWSLAALRTIVALDAGAPSRRLLVLAGVLTALAIATKDQAYGLFALTLPWALLRLRRHPRPWQRSTWLVGSMLAAYLIASGAALAPGFYRRHVETIVGDAKSPAGRVGLPAWLGESERAVAVRVDRTALASEIARGSVHAFGHAAVGVPLVIAGLGGLWYGRRRLTPLLLAGLGYVITFLIPAGYAPIRFLLPIWLMLAVGAGQVYALAARRWPAAAAATALIAVVASGWSGYITIDKLRHDSRHDLEAWLADNVGRDDRFEVFSTSGFPIYHPRFDPAQPVRSRGYAYWQAAGAGEIDRATDWVLLIYTAPRARLQTVARLHDELARAGSGFVHAATFERRLALDPDALDPLSPELVLYRREPPRPAR